MKRFLAAIACLAMAAISFQAVAAPEAPPNSGGKPESVRLLDVPFVPQSEVLCGGAALAMVLRYWGESAVLAEDFAALVEPGSAGIRTDDLVEAARARGWTALPIAADPSTIQNHLAAGRPMIVLTGADNSSGHYLVLVAWANGGVIAHDPAVGPYRVVRERDFRDAWARSGSWALLILPPEDVAQPAPPENRVTDASPFETMNSCDPIVNEGILQARRGDTAGAELKFRAAAALCPESSAPLRELAGLRFAAEDWTGAARMAERALALEPGDSLTWRLLAGSCFLAGDSEGALRAWNQVGEPRADLTHIEGLVRSRYHAVADQLDLPPRRLITQGRWIRARRRLAEVPAQSGARLSLKPLPGGVARVNVAVIERPLIFDGPWDAGGTVLRSALEREILIDVASPSGNGELWTAAYRWWTERPRLLVALAVPAAGGRPGIWSVQGLWERQTYGVPHQSSAGDTTGPGVIREQRRRASLSFSDWVAPNLRLEASAAQDRFDGRGTFASLEGIVDARWLSDRLGVRGEMAGWGSPGGAQPFRTGSFLVRWRSQTSLPGGWSARLGLMSASSRAPLALWPGAGTGRARTPLLRAHPLLSDGVLDGRAFGRTLVHGGIEKQEWPWTLGPLRLGWAVFVDGAKPWETLNSGRIPWQVDGGLGFRLGGMGRRGHLRLDVARGLSDGASAFSAGWVLF